MPTINKYQYFNCLLTVVIIFFSCKNAKKGPKNNEKEYYSNGRIMSEKIYDKSKAEREERFYYKNGVLMKQCYYINDNLNGNYFSYDTMGFIRTKAYFINGKAVGSRYYYYNGHIVLYNERNFEEQNYYIKKYDSFSNRLIKEEGVCLDPNLIDSKLLNLDSKNNILFFYSQPDQYLNQISVTLEDKPIKFDIINGHIGKVEVDKQKNKGKFLKIYSVLTTSDKKNICEDSLVVHIE